MQSFKFNGDYATVTHVLRNTTKDTHCFLNVNLLDRLSEEMNLKPIKAFSHLAHNHVPAYHRLVWLAAYNIDIQKFVECEKHEDEYVKNENYPKAKITRADGREITEFGMPSEKDFTRK